MATQFDNTPTTLVPSGSNSANLFWCGKIEQDFGAIDYVPDAHQENKYENIYGEIDDIYKNRYTCREEPKGLLSTRNIDVMRFLINQEFDVNEFGSCGVTPLHMVEKQSTC